MVIARALVRLARRLAASWDPVEDGRRLAEEFPGLEGFVMSAFMANVEKYDMEAFAKLMRKTPHAPESSYKMFAKVSTPQDVIRIKPWLDYLPLIDFLSVSHFVKFIEDEHSRRQYASRDDADPDALALLADDDSLYVRKDAISNPRLPDDVMKEIADGDDYLKKHFLLFNKAVPDDVLDDILAGGILRQSPLDTQMEIARFTESARLQRLMAENPDYRIRMSVANNRRADPGILDKLAGDQSVEVRKSVAENRSTSPETLTRLSDDPDGDVRDMVIWNSRTPKDVVNRMSERHDYKFIDWHMGTAPLTEETMMKHLDEYDGNHEGQYGQADVRMEICLALAGNPHITEKVARRILDMSRNWTSFEDIILSEFAGNNGIPAPVLDTIVLQYHKCYGAAADNPNASAAALAWIAAHGTEKQMAAVAWHKNTSPDTLSDLAEDASAYVRAAVAQNRRTPAKALAMLAGDEFPKVRLNAAGNPSTPPESLAWLARDPEESVRSIVFRNPSYDDTPSMARRP